MRARRAIACMIVAAATAVAVSPSPAFALSASLEAKRKADGVGVTAFAPPPVAVIRMLVTEHVGTVVPGGPTYSYPVTLAAGERLSCSLTAAPGTDFDLHLLWPDTSGPGDLRLAAAALGTSYPDTLEFDCASPGTYSLVLVPVVGDGDFQIQWSVGPAVSAGDVTRVWGGDRFATAVEASVRTFTAGSSRDVVLASGTSFADSLAACGLAGALGCPLLITQASTLPAVVAAEVTRLGVYDVHIVGGASAVSPGIASSLASSGHSVFRYQGPNRYATAAAVAAAIGGLAAAPPARVFVARGDLFADALVVSPLAYSQTYPVLLTRSDSLSPETASQIASGGYGQVIIAGAETAVSAGVARSIAALLPQPDGVVRLGGPDRYQTAGIVSRYGIERFWAVPDTTGVASGVDFPDAVCGGAAIGARGGVMVLTPPTALGASARDFVRETATLGLADDVLVFGGTSALSARVESDLAAEVAR